MALPRAPKALFTSLAIVAVLFLLVGCGKDSLVNPKIGPTADFSADPLTGDRPLDVTFTDLSTPGSSSIKAWFWNFGDGTTSTLQSVGHLYGAAGVYNVSLRVTTDDGTDTEVKQDYITVTKAGLLPPNAAFTASPTAGPPGTAVQFSDQSSAGSALNVTGWFWDFGDSTGTSTAQNPSHTYARTGTYDVTLSVTTSVGTDTETKAGFIAIAPTKPVANFAATPTAGQAPLAVNFTNQSQDGGSPITAWAWTFGDGASSTAQNPSHTYAAAGAYTVSLTATNALGSSSVTKAAFITVSAAPVGPTAGFIGAPTSGTAPLNVQFTDQSLAGTSAITAWSWTFGDGSTSTAQNPSHTYSAAGTYSVSLTVSTPVGANTATKTSYILVSPAPVAPTVDFSGAPTSGFVPLTVSFTDLSLDGGAPITSRVWSFGDGVTSTAQNPVHTYNSEGVYTVTLTASNSAGSNTATKTSYISAAHVPVAPVAAFSGTPTSGNAPLTVQFTDQSTPGSAPITSHVWDFGDASTSTAASPSHVFQNPGTYTVSLTVTTADGTDSETKTSYVSVAVPPTAPNAAFSGSPTSGFAPLTVNFTDASTNGGSPITSWLWRFGDGATSTSQNPSHVYATPGTYSVTLRVANAVGPDSTTRTNYITASLVPLAPTAAFSGTPTAGNAPLTVQFTDQSSAGTSPITARSWSFGDGGTSTATNPSHTYNNPGAYDVSLTVTTTVGSDGETKPAYVNVSAPPVGPTANFQADHTNGFAPLTVQFTDLSSSGTAAITAWAWTFGDGGTSTAQNPGHTYAAPGSYTVSLTVTTTVGSDNETKTSYITADVVPVGPTASFTGAPTSGIAPLAVTFTDTSTPGTSPILSRLWNFGDGATSTATNPSHTYNAAGSYTVTLGVATAVGTDSDTKTGYVSVSPAPTAPTSAFTADVTSGFVPLQVQFTDQSTNGGSPITAWSWNFGDGGSSSAQNPAHTYTVAGTYTVTLTTTNAVGSDPEVKTGYITAQVVPVAPTANFTGTPTSGNAPLTVSFTDTSTPGTAPITSRSWNFGDGGTSAATNPSHTYSTPGTYSVTLRVTSTAGSDTLTKDSYVSVSVPPTAPTANFTADQTSGFVPLSVQFSDASSSGGSPITSWRWTFGDGGTSTAQNPSHTYAVPGTYDVKLRVANAVGPDSTTKNNFITAEVVPVGPTADFTGTPTSGQAPLTVNFTDASDPGTSPITSRSWNFGDGGTSSAVNPSHTYNAAGAYTVSLTVTTTVGSDSRTRTSYISVSPAPTAPNADFIADQTSGFVPLAVNFTDSSTDGGSPITSWLWTFGDGATSTAENPAHTYTVPGTYTVKLRVANAVGPDSLTKAGYITAQVVPVGPTANFSGTPTSGDAPLTVDFTDASSPGTSPITSRSWAFGDGATSSATNPSHVYSSPGTYSVRLIVVTSVAADTLVKTDYVSVSVPPTAPTADFTADQTDGFVPLAVQFTDASSSGGQPITSWLWSFGDGGSSTSQNPSHTYLVPGTYDVKLRVANAVGPDSTTKSGYVTARVVPVAPTANFTGTPTSGDAPLSVDFTDTSDPGTSPITVRSWQFGDGGTSSATNPSHTYGTPGTYTVTLTVTTLVGSDDEIKTDYVTVNVPPAKPAADFSGTPTSGFAPLQVDFTDASTDGGAAITSWLWRFGDGATSTAQNPTHTYATPGTYDVTLRVTNSVGPDSTTKNGYVTASVVPVGPSAEFSGTPTSGDAPLTVSFTDLSDPGSSPITAYAWDFGDGGTSTEANPSHEYTTPGTYTVSLQVTTDVNSSSATKTDYVTVNVPPTLGARTR